MGLGDVLKKVVLPVAAGALLGPAATGILKGVGLGKLAANPFITNALASGLGSVVAGGNTKDALRSALLGGVGGTFAQRKFPKLTGQTTQQSVNAASQIDPDSTKTMTRKPIDAAKKFEPATMSGQLAQQLGFEDSLIGNLLNTKLGEGLAAGLLTQLFSSDEDEDSRTAFERRPFGFGGPGGQIGGIKYMQEGGDTKEQRMPREPRRPSGILEFLESDKPIFSPFGFGTDFDTKLEILKKLGFIKTAQQGGEMDFPRRDGGIDPSEGSGTKDDVPAMLTAGEFVLTKDAVKGLGNGNQRLGIQRAYDMMGQLERMA
jgi:hypothetical protein|tara:strand:- start:184 stop:1134 length:951 start_codon:yes stop_codon:yes gene_type:complete